MRLLTQCASVLLLLAATAAAQVTIGNVVNVGSRLPGTSQFYGLAQGSLFAITGKGLGPDPLQQATFPLPTTAGLAGVTVQASVGGATVDCILAYVSSTEVGAILPSMTPLGTGTVTLNNNGVTATKAITVVASAFGIFTTTAGGLVGQAMAFNVSAADGSTTPNGVAASAQPGQDVLINGTGLGAITSDETQSGVTDVPAATVQVYVGIVPAAVVSAGRGLCCDGLDPAFPVPEGIAAWDVIQFTVPAGVTGCAIPVVVQIGGFVSNLATISIDPSGAACALIPSVLPPALQQKLDSQNGYSIGSIALGREFGAVATAAGAVNSTKKDTGSATFLKITNVPAGETVVAQAIFPTNFCQINSFPGPNGTIIHNGTAVTPIPLMSVSLNAGTPLAVKGPSGSRSIVGISVGALVDYRGVTFGDATAGNYYDGGHYTVTGPGGKDVGAFTGSIDVPTTPFALTNAPLVTTPIDRTKDLTIKWTGGIPNTQVTVVGGSLVNGVNNAFLCAASVDAGQITIPSYVLLNLLPTGSSPLAGQLTVGNRTVSLFTASGLDLAYVGFATTYTLYLPYK